MHMWHFYLGDAPVNLPFAGIASLVVLSLAADATLPQVPTSFWNDPEHLSIALGSAVFALYWALKLWKDLKTSSTGAAEGRATGVFEGKATVLLEQLVEITRATKDSSIRQEASLARQEEHLQAVVQKLQEHDERVDYLSETGQEQLARIHESLAAISSSLGTG